MENVKNTTPETPPKKKFRRPFSIIEKEKILKVFNAYEAIHFNGSKTDNMWRTATATGASIESVYRILKEHKENGYFQPPSVNRRRKRLLDHLTEEDLDFIQSKFHSLFTQDKPPSVSTVLAAVNEETKYNFKRTSFWKVLKKLNLLQASSCLDEPEEIKIEETKLLDNYYIQNEESSNEINVKTEQSPIFENGECLPARGFTEMEDTHLDAIGKFHKKIKSEPEEGLLIENCKEECEDEDNSNCEDRSYFLDPDMPIKEENQNESSNEMDDTINDAGSTYDQKKNIKCNFCDFTTNSYSNRKRHIDTKHDELKNHKCDHCGYRAISSTSLKKHISRYHEKLKNHQCQLCESSFYNASSLKSHISSVHRKRKNYTCEHCDFTASALMHLKKHTSAVHQNIKDQKC